MYIKSRPNECYSCASIKTDGDFIKFNISLHLSLAWWIFTGFRLQNSYSTAKANMSGTDKIRPKYKNNILKYLW